MKYVVAIYHPVGYDGKREDEEMTKGISALNQEMVDAGVRYVVGGLGSAGSARAITHSANGDLMVTDGPYLETKEIIGGFWMLAAEWYAGKRPEQAEILWTVAIAVGIGQVVAGVFPGTSRSATTIFAAMLIGGANRAAATEFAFLVGIPTMYAASVYELYGEFKNGGGNENWTNVAVGFAVSAVVAFIAVKWLLRYIQTHRFTAFAWYRIVLGAGLLGWAALA